MKIINHSITLLSLIFCLVFLSSCFTEEIELDLNNQENKKVVIIGWLNNIDKDQSVEISYTQDYFNDTIIEFINDATVSLSYDSEVLTLENTSNGKYLLPSDWKGEIGTKYTLNVIHENEEYQAASTLRAMPEAQYVEYVFNANESDSMSYYVIYFGFQETPGEGDGYFAIDYKKNSNQKNIIRTGGWTNDEFADGEFYEDLSVTQNYHQIGDTVVLEIHSVGKKATEYFQSISTEIFRGGFLDPPPVNVPSNFSNGAVGYFLSSGKRQYEIIIE